jgi:predicted DNA-binding transcriptional regulator YafY
MFMPANKNQLLRMKVIVEMLRGNAYPNYSRFMAKMRHRDTAGIFELADKTFYRDIKDLRKKFGAPIEYDARERGFFLLNPNWTPEHLSVEPFEMKGVVLAQKVAESLMPDPIRADVTEAMSSLLLHNVTGFRETAELDMMQFINPLQFSISPDVFLTIFKAWESRQKLHLTYCSSTGESYELEFEPHVLAWLSGTWYLKGRPPRTIEPSDKEFRGSVLALHRISAAKQLASLFEQNKSILDSVINGKLFEFPRYPEVRLLFSPDMAQRVRERFSKPPSTIQEEADGSTLVTLHELTEYQIGELALWAWGKVKILSPEALRQEIQDFAQKLLHNQE